MTLLLADTFTASLARLTGDEQKAAKTTAFDLQMNPASPGMQFHKLERARDRSFWSVRVSSDLRLIVHKTADSLLLCYVGHHDDAYDWAERRKIERHPTTGAAQLVEIRETVREIEIPRYVEGPALPLKKGSAKRLFESVADDDLLGFGVPAVWLPDVRNATEDTLFDLATHLPAEAAEALLELATGGTPRDQRASVLLSHSIQPGEAICEANIDEKLAFSHPDARRRFRVMESADDLRRALDAPWDKWTVFLHPAQEDVVSRRYSGPARVAGSAGTGKTIVALHRAVRLARMNPHARVLLTTFNDTLERALRVKLDRLVGGDSTIGGRIIVSALDRVGLSVYESAFDSASIAGDATVRSLIARASRSVPGHKFTTRFLETEWREVVDQWQLTTWESYRDVSRLGRKTRLGEQQRAALWTIFERVRADLASQGETTMAGVFGDATRHLTGGAEAGTTRPFDFVVVDEAQDVGVAQLRFLAALAGDRPDGLFFAGDLGQRIFQTPFSWRALGVDVRGRSQTLRINYRTSHQIRRQADRLLGAEIADVDGNMEARAGTVSAFTGPEPIVQVVESEAAETSAIATWLRARVAECVAPDEMAVFVRSESELPRAQRAVTAAGLRLVELDGRHDATSGAVAVSTMHLAKGLEFRAVVVAACDDEVVPLQSRIESVTDEADLKDVYETERHLLYVACTRARDQLLVTGVAPGSEFLGDFRPASGSGGRE